MDRNVADRTETEEDMLTLDVSDDALERTAKEKRLLGHIAPTFGTTAWPQ
jgi:hypothetical protein